MTFLADAHTNRGVLRQAGAMYQFRHIELQRYLAAKAKNERATSACDLRIRGALLAFGAVGVDIEAAFT